MRLRQAIPPGSDVSPEELYGDLRLREHVRDDRPYVVCNFVSSADGKATASGRTAPLAGAADKAAFHLLRTQVDAVLAGIGTLEIEGYGVPVRDRRLEEIRGAQGRPAQPLAVVISRSGRVPWQIPLFADAPSRVAVYVPAGSAVARCAAEVIVHECDPGFALASVLRSLRGDHDVGSLLCEGGPILFNALLAEDLVDELFLALVWALEHDGNLLLRYARSPAGPRSAARLREV
jgi:riboflavin biosynthesis pyrimidine reductase